MRVWRTFGYACAGVVLLSSCDVGGQTDLAEFQTTLFHKRMAAGQCAEIYANASPNLQDAVQAAVFLDLCSNIRADIGAAIDFSVIGWQSKASVGLGKTLALTLETAYEGGTMREVFTYAFKDNEAKLLGYNYQKTSVNPDYKAEQTL